MKSPYKWAQADWFNPPVIHSIERSGIKSKIIAQLNFATASGSKWGDYDVDVEKLMGRKGKRGDN